VVEYGRSQAGWSKAPKQVAAERIWFIQQRGAEGQRIAPLVKPEESPELICLISN
tara:strand:+ start:151 stop:315 length:165 start_codon:yes stop_codon:yes gene_type:complete